METFDADGLIAPTVSDWSEEKYELIQTYAQMFATGMKNSWDKRVYIDLFAGAGRVTIKGTQTIVDATPLRVLAVPDPFDVAIFCEADLKQIEALQSRCKTRYPDREFHFVPGDTNANVDAVVKLVPHGRKGNTVLSLCFADPYDLKSLKFSTIRRISTIFVDFIILIATEMDAHRNIDLYLDPQNHVVEEFLGDANWRLAWKEQAPRSHFGRFIADQFFKNMVKLGFIEQTIPDSHHMRSTKKRLPLYRLAFFSRNKRGTDFWEKARKSTTRQSSLW